MDTPIGAQAYRASVDGLLPPPTSRKEKVGQLSEEAYKRGRKPDGPTIIGQRRPEQGNKLESDLEVVARAYSGSWHWTGWDACPASLTKSVRQLSAAKPAAAKHVRACFDRFVELTGHDMFDGPGAVLQIIERGLIEGWLLDIKLGPPGANG